jgi:hypothetical protein
MGNNSNCGVWTVALAILLGIPDEISDTPHN